MQNLILLGASGATGALLGIVLVLSIIATFEEMILSSFMNIYYTTLFFVVGSYYTYKIIKKN